MIINIKVTWPNFRKGCERIHRATFSSTRAYIMLIYRFYVYKSTDHVRKIEVPVPCLHRNNLADAEGCNITP